MPDDLLFDVPEPLTPVERLLTLAGEFTRHNDTIDLIRPTADSPPDLEAHAGSANDLAHESLAAVKAVHDQQLYASADLVDALVRIKQLAYLSSEAARHLTEAQEALAAAPEHSGLPEGVSHQIQLARELTALAAGAVVESATAIARETQRRRPAAATAAADLTPAELSALHAAARGHVVMTQSLGREYVHSRDHRVRISTLRSLESKGLIAREPGSAPPAFYSGLPQDRIRLTRGGTGAVAALLAVPTATPTISAPAAAPAPTTPVPARGR